MLGGCSVSCPLTIWVSVARPGRGPRTGRGRREEGTSQPTPAQGSSRISCALQGGPSGRDHVVLMGPAGPEEIWELVWEHEACVLVSLCQTDPQEEVRGAGDVVVTGRGVTSGSHQSCSTSFPATGSVAIRDTACHHGHGDSALGGGEQRGRLALHPLQGHPRRCWGPRGCVGDERVLCWQRHGWYVPYPRGRAGRSGRCSSCSFRAGSPGRSCP